MSDDITPKVWVGCLGCYNGGNLVGEWFDAITAPSETEGEDGFNVRVRNFPASHTDEAHEELWVMDHEGFDGFIGGEFSPSTGKRVAEIIAAIASDGIDPTLVKKWADVAGIALETFDWDDQRSTFEDQVRGTGVDSLAEYAREYFESSGRGREDGDQNPMRLPRFLTQEQELAQARLIPAVLWDHIDWENVGEDLTADETEVYHDGQIYLISSN